MGRNPRNLGTWGTALISSLLGHEIWGSLKPLLEIKPSTTLPTEMSLYPKAVRDMKSTIPMRQAARKLKGEKRKRKKEQGNPASCGKSSSSVPLKAPALGSQLAVVCPIPLPAPSKAGTGTRSVKLNSPFIGSFYKNLNI